MFSAYVEGFWTAVLRSWGWPAPARRPAIKLTLPRSAPPEIAAEPPPSRSEGCINFVPGADEEDEADESGGEMEEGAADWPVISPEEIAAARVSAEAEALCGPHRIFPSSPAGPGSLSEALKRLEQAGRVLSEFVDDPLLGPHLAYRPV